MGSDGRGFLWLYGIVVYDSIAGLVSGGTYIHTLRTQEEETHIAHFNKH